MRRQYSFWPGANGLDAWDVHRLIELTRDFPVTDVEVASIGEVNTDYWFGDVDTPTVRKIVEHIQLIARVDLRFPIILAPDGRVMDGMHRIARALLDGIPTLPAVRFETLPDPDHRDCRPSDLPYD